jgi:hypothetical protein
MASISGDIQSVPYNLQLMLPAFVMLLGDVGASNAGNEAQQWLMTASLQVGSGQQIMLLTNFCRNDQLR